MLPGIEHQPQALKAIALLQEGIADPGELRRAAGQQLAGDQGVLAAEAGQLLAVPGHVAQPTGGDGLAALGEAQVIQRLHHPLAVAHRLKLGTQRAGLFAERGAPTLQRPDQLVEVGELHLVQQEPQTVVGDPAAQIGRPLLGIGLLDGVKLRLAVVQGRRIPDVKAQKKGPLGGAVDDLWRKERVEVVEVDAPRRRDRIGRQTEQPSQQRRKAVPRPPRRAPTGRGELSERQRGCSADPR